MPLQARKLESRLPSDAERAAANQLRQILAARASEDHDHKLRVTDQAGGLAEIVLSPGLSNLLMELLRHIGAGDGVTLVPVSQMLTTQEAADILNVSRPYLISLLERNEIPFTKVGRHRRVMAAQLLSYKKKIDEKRAEALATLAEHDADYI